MKPTSRVFLFLVIFIFFQQKLSAQSFQTTIPSSVCANSAANASVVAQQFGATSYTWSTNPTAFISPLNSSATAVGITFTTCGSHSVICTAMSAQNTPIITSTIVTTVVCPGLTVSPASQTICPGGAATLSVTGSSTYTWNNGATTNTISVSPSTNSIYTAYSANSICATSGTVVIFNTTITASSNSICPNTSLTLTADGATGYSWFQPPNNLISFGTSPSIILTPSTLPLTYTVNGSFSNCPNSKTITIGLKSLVLFAVAPPSVCPGAAATIIAANSPMTSYTWSTPGHIGSGSIFTHSQNAVTVYSLAADSAGCVGSQTISVGIYHLPVVTISSLNDTICPNQTAILNAGGASSYTWVPDNSIQSSLFSYSLVVNPISTTVYSVSGTSSVGCISSAAYTLETGQMVSITFTPTTYSVCTGFTSTITAEGAGFFTWRQVGVPGLFSGPEFVAGTGTFVLTGSNGGSCADSNVIVISPLPDLNLTTTQSTTYTCIQTNGNIPPVTLTASGAATYVWLPYTQGYMTFSLGPIVAVTPTVPTCYTVTGSTSSCKGSKVLCVKSEYCAGISEQHENSFEIFPNPAEGELTITSTTAMDLEILNTSGVIVYSENILAGRNQINLEKFPPGLYFISTRSGGNFFRKLIVN